MATERPFSRASVFFLACCEALRDRRLSGAEAAMLKTLSLRLGLSGAEAAETFRRARTATDRDPGEEPHEFDADRIFAAACGLARDAAEAEDEIDEVLELLRRQLWIGRDRGDELRARAGLPAAGESDIVILSCDEPEEGIPYDQIFRPPEPVGAPERPRAKPAKRPPKGGKPRRY